ncbi:HD domain-containing phosphohydrolase [Desulfopila aestuarii]|nr:HD domain-containing phosphohydrolase [Desulfopila aestuarii]
MEKEIKILFVDDEVNVLDSMRRQLRKRYDIVTALSGREALEKMKTEGPFAVVVSDMRMPEMDGIQLLKEMKALYPDTVRMMLTGNADQETATEAVNQGQIFRFLTKPCPVALLTTSIALAVRQHRLITAEKQLLDETLNGTVKVLSELLSFAKPTAFSSVSRVRAMAMDIARSLGLSSLWQMDIAVLLSQVGCVTLPDELLSKIYSGVELSAEEEEMYRNHPKIAASLLEHIPRMENVAFIIEHQFKDYSVYAERSEYIEDEDELSLAAQILKAAFAYDMLMFRGKSHEEVIRDMSHQQELYNPRVVKRIKKVRYDDTSQEVLSLRVQDLAVGMVVEKEIIAKNGTLLAPRGQELTWPVLQGLVNFSRKVGVKEPIMVRMNRTA